MYISNALFKHISNETNNHYNCTSNVLYVFNSGYTCKIGKTAPAPMGFQHKYAMVNGVKIHYVVGGKGEPLLLIHGFGQNWFMWNRLMPELSKNFIIIAPDLRGFGESSKPADGYDKKTMATDMHELIKKLGYTSINVAGHDIGLMVAYAYAVQFGSEVKKIALLDAVLPGVDTVWSDLSGDYGGLVFLQGLFQENWWRARHKNF